MKFQSAIINVGNVLVSIIVFVSTMYNHIYYYEGNKSIFYAMLFLIVIANGILAIANFKRNKAIMALNGLIATIWITVVALGMSANIDKDINSTLLILKVILALITIMAIIAEFFVPKTKKATKLNAINLVVEKDKEEQEEASSIDEAFKVESVGKKEEVVGIANLVAKIFIPILWALFASALVVQIIEPGKIYDEDKKVLLTGLNAIGEYQQKKGYVYQLAENEYEFLDENGTFLNKIAVEKLSNFDDNYTWKFNYPDKNHEVEILIAKQKNKVQIINTEGKVFFEIEKRYDGEAYRTLAYLIKQAIATGDVPKTASLNYEENKERKENVSSENEVKTEEDYDFETKINAYYRVNVTPELKEFEENENYNYLYFKNANLSENIIQVAITKENSGVVSFLEKYLKHKEKVFNISDEHQNAIQEFYRYKKEYKLIHLPSKTSVVIEERDVLYDAFTIKGEEKEVIYAYADGSIPFMNSEYNTFVTTNGRILGRLDSSGVEPSVFSLVDDTNIIATRIDTELSILYDKTKVVSTGTFKDNENRHEGKKIIDLGIYYYLYPIDQADTNKECVIQTKGYSNDNGVAKTESSQVRFVGSMILTLFNKKNNRYEIYQYSHGDCLLLRSQNVDPKMHAVGMKTALPGGYGPYDLIGIYDK